MVHANDSYAACGTSLHRDVNAARVMLLRGLAAIAAAGEAAPQGTRTWADTPCVIPELSLLPGGIADDTSSGVINSDDEEPKQARPSVRWRPSGRPRRVWPLMG